MNINTPHKGFNHQSNLIGGKGNIIANTMIKWHIRKDHIKSDARPIIAFCREYPMIREFINKHAKDQNIYISVLFHTINTRDGSDKRVIHGVVASTELDMLIDWWIVGRSWKSAGVVYECVPLIADMSVKHELTLEYWRDKYYHENIYRL